MYPEALIKIGPIGLDIYRLDVTYKLQSPWEQKVVIIACYTTAKCAYVVNEKEGGRDYYYTSNIHKDCFTPIVILFGHP